MKKTLRDFLLSIAFSGGCSLFAQTQTSPYLKMNHRSLDTRKWSVENDLQNISAVHFAGKSHFIFRFNEIPSAENRNELKSHGILLIDYLPDLCYIVSIPKDSSLNYLPEKIKPSAIIPILDEYKIQQSLKEFPLPNWAIKEIGTIDLNLSYYSDLSIAEIKPELIKVGYNIISTNDYGNYLTVRIQQDEINSIASLPYISWIEPVSPDPQPENYTGRSLHRSNVIASDFISGRHYDGTGIVIALGDDGPIGPHIDYQGRVDNSRVTINTGNHGDHVGGIIMGAGNLDPRYKGMAFGSFLEVFDVWHAVNDSPTSFVTDSVIITSTSYSDGCNTGYTSFARTADQIIRQNPKLLHVFSSGNNGTDDCSYGAGANWGNITGGVKMGKNLIAVGNLNASDVLDPSSSRGPATDGRIKPEVCAKGTDVTSTIDPNTYTTLTGTSMSCPGTSGTIAQLNQAYRELNGGQWASSGLIKGILMNSADDLGNPGPDFLFGFGRINGLNAVKCLEDHRYFTDTLSQGQSDQFNITIPPGTAQLKVMLYWHDWEAASMATTALVNNLQLKVTDPSLVIWDPWVLDPTPIAANLNANAVRGTDMLNNMEQVTLDNPAAGTYSVDVSSVLIPQGPQEYFIVYEVIDSSITLTYPFGGEPIVPNVLEVIRWDSWGSYGNFDIDYSLDSGSNWLPIAAGISGALRRYFWNVPNSLTGKALVRITRGNFSDVSDSTFSIMTVPTNLQVIRSCPTSATLKWNLLPNATSYDIYMLGNKYMDPVGTTNADTFIVPGISQFSENWFAVSAHGPDNANGRRCIAINKAPGVWNCLDQNDVSVLNVLSPSNGVLISCVSPGSMIVKVTLENLSPNPVTAIPIFYQLNSNPVVVDTFNGILPGYGTAIHSFSILENFSAPGFYQIKSWTHFIPDVNHFNDSVISFTQVITGSPVAYPYTQDFETFNLCSGTPNCGTTVCNLSGGWVNPSNTIIDELDWRVYSGPTATTLTGPDVDHNPGTFAGKYLYLEGSGCFGKRADLISPCIDLTLAVHPEVGYWANLYGASMGELHLDLFADSSWTNDIIPAMISDWGNQWWVQQADLSAWNGKIILLRWRGITGMDNTTDMAIDDIRISEPVGIIPGADQFNGFTVYPIPGDGLFTIENKGAAKNIYNFLVSDLQGRKVYSEGERFMNENEKMVLDLRTLSSGVYFIHLKSENDSWNYRLVIR